MRLCLAVLIACLPASGSALDLYVAPHGDDAADGRTPAAEGESGPLATLTGARARLRALRAAGELSGPATVHLRGGTYRVDGALVLTAEDSGTPDAPVTFRAYEGETPVVSGGVPVSGWASAGEGLWRAPYPLAEDAPDPRALWINGERRTIARSPNETEYFKRAAKEVEQPKLAMRYRNDDIQAWPDIDRALVWVFHAWNVSAHRIAEHDPERNHVTFTHPAPWDLGRWEAGQRYYIEGVRAALDAPGEWLYDRADQALLYRPLPGETPDNITAVVPVATQLIRVAGTPDAPVNDLHFEGLTFQHTDWPLGEDGYTDVQAAYTVPGALQFSWAHRTSVKRCTIAHTGTYALWLAEGCTDNVVQQVHAYDLGAGGLRVGMLSKPVGAMESDAAIPTRNTFDNNFLHAGGRAFPEGVGIWIGHANHTTVTHNEIADFYYSGVSNGWVWGYGENPAHHNVITHNHIHHIGRNKLSDMGGIYNLGIQPGTVLRFNHIHHVNSYKYGGWGLYTDEGSSQILLEKNLVHDTTSGNFDQHYGRDNVVRNNIFAFSQQDQLTLTRPEEHVSFTFRNNILVLDNGRVTNINWTRGKMDSDENLYFDTQGNPLQFGQLDFETWQSLGRDNNSLVADPGFTDAEARDFSLAEDSPALALGFEPFSVEDAGLYGEQAWTSLPDGLTYAPLERPAPRDE